MTRVLALLIWLSATAVAAQPIWVVDFVYLAEGHTLEDHDRFANDAAHFAARYGVVRRVTLDRVPGFAHPGPIAPDRIDLWSVPDEAALDAWRNDVDRVWYEDLGSFIMDGQSSRYAARDARVEGVAADGLHLIDILRFADGLDPGKLEAYLADLADTGGRHGLRPAIAMGTVEHASGPFGRVDRLDIRGVPGAKALDRLLSDAAFRSVEKQRRALFDRGGTTRQLYRARSGFAP